MRSSARLDLLDRQLDHYYCVFLAKHPKDATTSNDASRWWSDWYCFSRGKFSSDIIFGTRTLFRPNVHPDASKYIQWADTLDLASGDTTILGPFNFTLIAPGNQTRNFVPLDQWVDLLFKYST